MQNNKTKKFRPNFYKVFKRKILFSEELKKSIFTSFSEAKNKQTHVDINVLLYGLLSQPNSLSTRLFLKAIPLSNKNNKLNLSRLYTKIIEINYQKFGKTIEIQEKPFLTPEVREILKKSTRCVLKNKKKICIITTKDLFFELINRESIRDVLFQLVN